MKKISKRLSLISFILMLSLVGIHRISEAGWVKMKSGTDAELLGIWGTSSADVFAVGYVRDYTAREYKSTILYYDGNSWTEMETETKAQLYGILDKTYSLFEMFYSTSILFGIWLLLHIIVDR